VVNLLFIVVVEFSLYCEPVGLLEPGDYVQDVPLKSG
jgi:hypothetical protein